MKLITKADEKKLLNNGKLREENHRLDPEPVVKLFTPDAQATWLLSELDPEDPDLAFGLCDMGFGQPELGYVRISEISRVRGKLGLPVEREIYFSADKTISAYAEEARTNGRIAA